MTSPVSMYIHWPTISSRIFLSLYFCCQMWYRDVMPLYFPRTKDEEELAAKVLPADLGDEFGEPIIQERMIRISDNPLVKGKSPTAQLSLRTLYPCMQRQDVVLEAFCDKCP